MMKRTIAIGMAIMIAAASFACGNSGNNSSSGNSNSSENSEALQESNEEPEADAPAADEAETTGEAEADASAGDQAGTTADDVTGTSTDLSKRMIFKEGGVVINTPVSYENNQDKFTMENATGYLMGDGICYTVLYLVPNWAINSNEGSTAEAEAAGNEGSTAGAEAAGNEAGNAEDVPINVLVTYVGLSAEQDESVIDTIFTDKYLPARKVRIGTVGDYTFYRGEYDSFDDGTDEESAGIIKQIRDELNASEVEIEEPVNDWTRMMGETFRFETDDLDGNPVSSAELFAPYKVTMINIWTSWCVYCEQEMPELNELRKEYADKGVNVIGFLFDSDEEGAIEEGKKLLADTGAEYLNLQIVPAYKYLPLSGFPTTIFVDSEGKMVALPVEGMNVQAYRETLDKLLAAD